MTAEAPAMFCAEEQLYSLPQQILPGIQISFQTSPPGWLHQDIAPCIICRHTHTYHHILKYRLCFQLVLQYFTAICALSLWVCAVLKLGKVQWGLWYKLWYFFLFLFSIFLQKHPFILMYEERTVEVASYVCKILDQMPATPSSPMYVDWYRCYVRL